MKSLNHFDAIIIGGGHNGLVAGSYLQKAELKTIVLEARHMIGGSCVTEEIIPGFKFCTTSYVCSLLSRKVMKDLELERHGLRLYGRDPSSFTPFSDGRSLTFWDDAAKTHAEISKFSKKDADAYPKYEEMLTRIAEFVEPLLHMTPTDPLTRKLPELFSMAKLGIKARGLGADFYEKVRMLSGSVSEFLDRFFESDELKAVLATDGVIGAFAGPRTPGTAYVLLHHVMGDCLGKKGAWANVKGGMGGITQAMAAFYRSKGGEIRTSTRVKKILTKEGKAIGVKLESGDEYFAPIVISNADPHRTFLGMLDPTDLEDSFRASIEGIKFKSATFKLNLALNDLPSWKAKPGPGPHHNGTIHICENMEYIERAFDEAKYGEPSTNPVLECTLPSIADPEMAPPGKHVMSVFIQYAPYDLKNGNWDQKKEAFAKRCIDVLDNYAPGIKNSIAGYQALSPLDLEREYGLTGGNIFHGELSLDQLFFMRPTPGFSRYRTPIKNLYLCGAGTHPGGGVTGIPGHNCAKEVLKDR